MYTEFLPIAKHSPTGLDAEVDVQSQIKLPCQRDSPLNKELGARMEAVGRNPGRQISKERGGYGHERGSASKTCCADRGHLSRLPLPSPFATAPKLGEPVEPKIEHSALIQSRYQL